jgi:hypothetical protein
MDLDVSTAVSSVMLMMFPSGRLKGKGLQRRCAGAALSDLYNSIIADWIQ